MPESSVRGRKGGPMGTGAERNSLQSFSHWLLPTVDFFFFIQSFVTSVFVLLFSVLSTIPQDLCCSFFFKFMYYCYYYYHYHYFMCVSALCFLFPFPHCLTYSFFRYLLTTYYVPDIVLGTRGVGAMQTFPSSCFHRLCIQIGERQHRKGIR